MAGSVCLQSASTVGAMYLSFSSVSPPITSLPLSISLLTRLQADKNIYNSSLSHPTWHNVGPRIETDSFILVWPDGSAEVPIWRDQTIGMSVNDVQRSRCE